MASPQVGSVSAKLSFAKVAAMKVPNVAVATPNPSEDRKSFPNETNSRRKSSNSAKLQPPILPPKSAGQPTIVEVSSSHTDVGPATGAIEGLSLVKDAITTANGARSAESGDSLEDDRSHLSNSSTKQRSFETKSMASVTTFAMDEKESIRPDDSASVRAADDDEPIPSLSRNATFQSESDVIMPSLRGGARPGAPSLVIGARRFHTLTNPPRFGDLPVNSALETDDVPQNVSQLPNEPHEDRRVRMSSLPIPPDEKLLDALATPKDRLPILQLEERILAFIGQSSVEFMDLPPQNSFARLLAHKLADYYGLAHHINEDGTSIRIFRNVSVDLPMPLAIVAKSIPIESAQPATAMKIMRRAGLGPRQFSAGGSTAASSSVPSKATSEAGFENTSDEGLFSPGEGTPSRDKSKLTREEREAQYKAARDRIFGDFQEVMTVESASTGENSASLSRSSSSSGKKKTRKQKTPKDDSFEARSAFVASYGPMQVSATQTQYQPQYPEQSFYGSLSNNFNPNINTYGTTPTQAYPGLDQGLQFNNQANYGPSSPPSFGSSDAWSGMQLLPSSGYFNFPQAPTAYQQNVPPMMTQMNNHYLPQPGPNMQQSPGWMNASFQNPYQQPASLPNANTNSWSGYPPYQYGQLPAQNLPSSTQHNSQHPLPGSYNRSLFNPQTRSFVPSNVPSRNGGRNGRKKTSPATGSNRNGNSHTTFGSDTSANTAVLSHRGQDVSNSSSPKPKEDSLQQKYGAPAHLPKKPPPSQVPSSFEVESTANSTSITPPFVVNGAGRPGGPPAQPTA